VLPRGLSVSVRGATADLCCPVSIDVDYSSSKGLRRLLEQIVTDAAPDDPVRVFAHEFLAIGIAVPVWCSIGIAFKGDRRHGHDRTFGKPLFQNIIFRLAFGQVKPPAVIVNRDGNVVRVVERCRGAIERGIIELLPRRSDLPNQLREIAPLFVVADSTRRE
jgi:hypothetical protein